MKKRLLSLLVCLCLLSVCGCATELFSEGQGELKIVASSFPAFDLARQIAGDSATVTLLQSSGADLHNYTPSPQALSALTEADVFICNGGVSDELWLSQTLLAADNPDLIIIKMLDHAEPVHAELESHNESSYCLANHTHAAHDHEHSEDDGHTADEHVWMSIKTMIKVVCEIARSCSTIAPANADLYQTRASEYAAALTELDAEYELTVAASTTKTIVCADRFPFSYLTRDYGICHFSAFSGCSSESEAAFDTFVKLANAIVENQKDFVLITETGDSELSDALEKQTGCKTLVLNSMQSVSRSDIKNGATYLKIMKENLIALRSAL